MTEHLTIESIERYRRRETDEAQRRETDSHLASCDACRKKVLTDEHAELAFNALNEALLPGASVTPFHFSTDELRRFASEGIPEADRVIYNSHLELCSQCDEELRQLSEPASAPAASVGTLGTKETQWLRPIWAYLTPVRAFALIALVGLIALAIVQYRRQQSSKSNSEVAQNASQNGAGPSPAITSKEGPSPESVDKSGASTPTVVVQLKDNNREIRLDQNGNLFGLEDIDDATQNMVKAALSGEALAKPKVLDDLSPPPIKLLGPSSGQQSLLLTTPLGMVVSEARPTFRWRPLSGADSYRVSIFDENFNLIAKSPRIIKSEWTSSGSLPRGRNYSWDVTAFQNDKEMETPAASEPAPKPVAKFRILEAEKSSALARLRQQKPVSHLALGLAYARSGLVDEAEREFRQVLRENPESVPAKNLLASVRTWQAR